MVGLSIGVGAGDVAPIAHALPRLEHGLLHAAIHHQVVDDKEHEHRHARQGELSGVQAHALCDEHDPADAHQQQRHDVGPQAE